MGCIKKGTCGAQLTFIPLPFVRIDIGGGERTRCGEFLFLSTSTTTSDDGFDVVLDGTVGTLLKGMKMGKRIYS